MILLHITSQSAWETALAEGVYRVESLETEGFIHASLPDQAQEVADRFYQGQTGLALLVIESERVKPAIRFEAADNGKLYPHLYGPLNVDAVTEIIPLTTQANGSVLLPDIGVRDSGIGDRE
jgi:uncharacterized protein (DUF952 family)